MAEDIPSVDRMWELMEMAYDDGITVLGWADNIVAALPRGVRHTFDVTNKPERSHEDSVLVVAIRVPHPDEMTFEQVVADEPPVRTVQSKEG